MRIKNLFPASIILALLSSVNAFAEVDGAETNNRFGSQLFSGNFQDGDYTTINENYAVKIGDVIQLNIWGALKLNNKLTVDKQGNIFIPHVGAVSILGVLNKDLNRHISKQVEGIFKNNVEIYANLVAATPVQIFVSGHVNHPGLYNGSSADSVLKFIDLAGGITDDGSFIKVNLLRNNKVIDTYNLYSFLTEGKIKSNQLRSGDTILVTPKQNEIYIHDLNGKETIVEINPAETTTVKDLLKIVPIDKVTHIKKQSLDADKGTLIYGTLEEALDWEISPNDEITYVSDMYSDQISIRIEGEHRSNKEIIVDRNATLGDLYDQLTLTSQSNADNLQLFRKSVKESQKALIDQSLNNLKKSVLTARSDTVEAAQLRRQEADLILDWIEQAKEVEPKGQAVLSRKNWRETSLEDGDIIYIPKKTNFVSVAGEVLFPRDIAYDEDLNVHKYISLAGGLTQNDDTSKVVIMKANGSFITFDLDDRKAKRYDLEPGDKLMVLPSIDTKNVQYTKDISQIIYQIAVAASVVIGL